MTQAPQGQQARSWHQVLDQTDKGDVPEGLWMRCPACETSKPCPI